MKRLILAALWGCVALAHAAPPLPCIELEEKTGLQFREQLSQLSSAELTELQNQAEAELEIAGVVPGLMQFCGIGVPKNVEAALATWKTAALEGRNAASLMLFAFYMGEFGDAPDKVKAAEWLIFAAQTGDPELQFALGMEYLQGGIVPKDVAQAERFLLRSAGQGNADAQEKLGSVYLDATRYSDALKWLNLSALQGRKDAQYLMGRIYRNGLGLKARDAATAVKWWRLAAEQRHSEAQLEIGRAYEYGVGVEKNHTEAIKWYQFAVEQGYLPGMEALAELYELDAGMRYDKALAFHWWLRMALIHQHLPAQVRVGWMYIRGIGVAKNPVEGVRWFRMAAERDMPEAHTSLALAYEYGLGAPVDFDIAFGLRLKSHNRVHRNELIDSCAFLPEDQLNERDARDFRRNMHTRTPETFVHKAESYLTSGNPPDALCWYQRYADSAYTEGRYSLGKFYLANGGIPVDTKRGLHYLRVAAAQGSVPARVSLAQMFEAGYVVPKSLVAACALRFTTSRGLKDLDNVIDTCHLSIKDKMTADQIMLATQLIRDMLMPGQYISSLDRAISQ